MLTAQLPTVHQETTLSNPCAELPDEAMAHGLHDLEEGLPGRNAGENIRGVRQRRY